MTTHNTSISTSRRQSNQHKPEHEKAACRLRQSKPGPKPIQFPTGWTQTGSWRRAQSSPSTVGPISPETYRLMLGYPNSADIGEPYRVTFAILDGDLVVECACDSYHYRQWCAHVAHLWWRWVRDRLVVVDLDTGRSHRTPPVWLSVGDSR